MNDNEAIAKLTEISTGAIDTAVQQIADAAHRLGIEGALPLARDHHDDDSLRWDLLDLAIYTPVSETL